jgi:hypothetical protein
MSMTVERWARTGCGLVLGAVLVTACSSGASKGPFTLKVTPSTQEASLSSPPVQVKVLISPASADKQYQPAAYQLTLNYDPKILKAESVVEGGYLGGLGRSTLCPSTKIDNGAGKVNFACASMSGATKGPKSDELVVITFSALGVGTSSLDLRNADLANELGDGLNFQVVNGAITVR